MTVMDGVESVDAELFMKHWVGTVLREDAVASLPILIDQSEWFDLSLWDFSFTVMLPNAQTGLFESSRATILEFAVWVKAKNSLDWLLDLALNDIDANECISKFVCFLVVELNWDRACNIPEQQELASFALNKIAERMHEAGTLDMFVEEMENNASEAATGIVKNAQAKLCAMKEAEVLRNVTAPSSCAQRCRVKFL